MEKHTFFKGLRVVELASVLAGPAVGMFFAELGAEVIKVENPRTEGDITRRWKLPSEAEAADYSAYYCSVNYKKETIFADLSTPAGREQVHKLIEGADVLISNFKRASARRMGLDYESLRESHPRLIYAQLDAFGEEEALPAFDVVLQAEAGFLYMTGEPGRSPVKLPVALIDLLAAHQLKEGVLLALLHRSQSGAGSFVSASLLESAIASLANQATNWLMEGHIPQPMGSQHPNIAPYGDIFYSSDDKPLVIAVGTEQQFAQLCQAVGLPELPADPRFANNKSRVLERAALCQLLQPAFQKRQRTEWMSCLAQAGVPVGSIRDMQEVFERPQAQRMILEDVMPDGRAAKRVRTAAFHWTPNRGG